MPPKLEIPDEAFRSAVKAAIEREQRRDISKKVLTFSVVSLIAILGTLISATAVVVRKLDQIWTLRDEHRSWAQVKVDNPGFKVPDVYLIHEESATR